MERPTRFVIAGMMPGEDMPALVGWTADEATATGNYRTLNTLAVSDRTMHRLVDAMVQLCDRSPGMDALDYPAAVCHSNPPNYADDGEYEAVFLTGWPAGPGSEPEVTVLGHKVNADRWTLECRRFGYVEVKDPQA
jgi:hypothetical protein